MLQSRWYHCFIEEHSQMIVLWLVLICVKHSSLPRQLQHLRYLKKPFLIFLYISNLKKIYFQFQSYVLNFVTC